MSWSRCDVCGKSAKGFALRCGACSFQMHPCCAMLSTRINVAVHPHALTLLPTDSHYYCTCNECSGKRKSGRVYRCTTCEDNESYYLHAVCAKSFINGLHDNGIPTPQKPSALGTAARVASQVVTEFIGGLFEGIGEGVAEALLQNIMPRGRRQLHHN
ncbi:Cysteine/Histidine-rich C1 domain family protein [Striga hermonthica]|uniref:Cysteine/Histidine-rich C1 domain family protein n=1 Tax=Striga hermonthica TaxID=68872 RepID=A0A9N7RBH6_STRHE|nr:Cysteine/Histidine-rich C1 domain family protein [Striga hermonthica]